MAGILSLGFYGVKVRQGFRVRVGCCARAAREVLLHGCTFVGDCVSPILVDFLGFILNVAMDWVCVYNLECGPLGLVVATQIISNVSLLLQFLLLKRQLKALKVDATDLTLLAAVPLINMTFVSGKHIF